MPLMQIMISESQSNNITQDQFLIALTTNIQALYIKYILLDIKRLCEY